MSERPPVDSGFDRPDDDARAAIRAFKSVGLVASPDEITEDVTFPDGFRRVERADGTIERHYADSVWIVALDGTTTVWRTDDTATVFNPDGSRSEIDASGGRHDVRADGTASDSAAETETRNDGRLITTTESGAAIITDLDGTRTMELPDGTTSVSRVDGTVERITSGARWVTGIDGTTRIERRDGSVSTLHPDGSRTDVSPDGTVFEVDSHEHHMLTDTQVYEAPPRNPWILPALVAVAGVVVAVVIAVVVLAPEGRRELGFVTPDAVESLRGAPASFDVEAWCREVEAVVDARVAADTAFVEGEPDDATIEELLATEISAVERTAEGAPEDLKPGWIVARGLLGTEAAALRSVDFDVVRHVGTRSARTAADLEQLDRFILEQYDACLIQLTG